MKIIGLGVDIVETARIAAVIEKQGDRFLQRVFTAEEIVYCSAMKFSARHYAARFAAKEAVSKAFGTGIGEKMEWRDVEVRRKESGEPYLALQGGAARLAEARGVAEMLLSLSHSDHYAVASVLFQGNQ